MIETTFQNLLAEYCKTRNYVPAPKLEYKTKSGKLVYSDGTIKDAIRMAIGTTAEQVEGLKVEDL